jgi:hypothetical protein
LINRPRSAAAIAAVIAALLRFAPNQMLVAELR